jgi:CheY-like chemotaxis protein
MALSAEHEMRPDVPRCRLLIVDDEDLVRSVVASILRRSGFEVTEARDGIEALASARATPPDAVLTDLNMPRCNGEGLCVALKGDPATAGIPIILMTGSQTDEAHMRSVGCIAVLYKPLPPSVGDRLRGLLA